MDILFKTHPCPLPEWRRVVTKKKIGTMRNKANKMKGMKYILPSITGRGMGVGFLIALVLTACEKAIIDEEQQSPNATLQIRTTRGADDAIINYPVQVYVFQGEDCKAVQTIGDEGQMLNIALVEGAYSVYAVGGASSTDYTLPTKDGATTTTTITLKDGKVLTDLMAAQATTTLADGEENTVTLGMERKVMLLQDVTIKQVPTAATAVSVTISPLWENIAIGGTYGGTAGTTTIALAKQSDNRTWKTSANAYLLPPSSTPASIKVSITTASGTKSYTYSTSDELEAGYKINIEGTYTETVGVNLSGTITGATWLGERTIRFDFDEGNNDNSDNNDNNNICDNHDNSDNIPTVGSIYQTCYVLSVTDNGDNADVTLVSPNEVTMGRNYAAVTSGIYDADAKAADVAAAVDAKIAEADVDAISDWHLPTATELNAIYAAIDDINAAFDTDLNPAGNYLYTTTAGAIYYRSLSIDSEGNEGFGATARVRPVVMVTIAKE